MSIPYRCFTFQDYLNRISTQRLALPNVCYLNAVCQSQKCAREVAQYNQQRVYSQMCRHPELFPLISSTYNIGLTEAQQRMYSNMFWRRLGSAMTTGTNLPGFGATSITGSEVPFTN